MCLCCTVKARIIKRDILPGYNLMISMVGCDDWPKGYYGLQRYNDPDFIWKLKVEIEPDRKFRLWQKWADDCTEMEKSFVCDPEIGYYLYKACLKSGYSPKKDGFRWIFWLRNYMAKRLKVKNYDK